MFSILLTIFGLSLFESISSLDNAIINAQILRGMSERGKRWFLFWGILFAVIVMRGVLPWVIVCLAAPQLGPIVALTAGFSHSEQVSQELEKAAPLLLLGGGVFLLFLFLDWLFLREKQFGLPGERLVHNQPRWFYLVIIVLSLLIGVFAWQRSISLIISAIVGVIVFFITHGLRELAEKKEQQMLASKSSNSSKHSGGGDLSKLIYLELIDAVFSVDGVIGSFAFTLSVPLIFLGNGLGAIILRQLTVGNIDRIKEYIYLENGAMYSVLCLGVVMLLRGFDYHIPEYLSPLLTVIVIGYFFLKSKKQIKKAV